MSIEWSLKPAAVVHYNSNEFFTPDNVVFLVHITVYSAVRE
jgi:hypothetical protein